MAFDDVDWAAEEEVFGGGFGFEGGGVVGGGAGGDCCGGEGDVDVGPVVEEFDEVVGLLEVGGHVGVSLEQNEEKPSASTAEDWVCRG